MLDLNFVSRVYGFWGRVPLIYNLSNLFTYLGKEHFLRWRLLTKLKWLAVKTPDSKVLDLACGNGSNFEYLQSYIGKNGRIYGYDYSIEMLQSAYKRIKKHSWKNIQLKQGDAAKLPFENDQFDVILSTLGVSAIPAFKSALDECYRVFRQGGTISILDAKLFEGTWRILNPAIKIVYSIGASWDYTKDIIGEFKKRFKHVEIEKFNQGTMYIISGQK
ncbi:MAG: class I SAM-dependent methyltransferase [Candidatus Helarchaeota archaeon]